MSSRQVVQVLFLAAGLCILALLMMPAVHLPCLVVHGPTTALRAQRWALMLVLFLRAAAFLFAGMALSSMAHETLSENVLARYFGIGPSCRCVLRC